MLSDAADVPDAMSAAAAPSHHNPVNSAASPHPSEVSARQIENYLDIARVKGNSEIFLCQVLNIFWQRLNIIAKYFR